MNTADSADVCVVGLGYVGETMAAAFLDAGMSVLGIECNDERREALQSGRAPIQEPGVDEVLVAADDRFTVVASLADAPLPKNIVLCVGTPVNHASGHPEIMLDQLTDAIKDLALMMTEDYLVVVRSTVPIGTCDRLVVPTLSEKIDNPLVAMCPERTIQGKALHEIRTLPQVIGAASPESFDRAVKLFRVVAPCQTLVSCLAAAEAVKLFCNAHTDLIYAFGNQVARASESLGIDAYEVITSANIGYPRPDLQHPGYVGGSCLTKDPYMLLQSLRGVGYEPSLTRAARALNEDVPGWAVDTVLDELASAGVVPTDARIAVLGLAYKGDPRTDDVRGAAYPAVLERLRERGVSEIRLHDNVVSLPEESRPDMAQMADVRDAAYGCHALIILNNQVEYRKLPLDELAAVMVEPRVVYDLWSVVDPSTSGAVTLRRFGRG